MVIHMYLVHTFPPIACFLNSICTNCILKRELWIFIVYCAIIYVAIYYYLVKTYGVVLYEFLNFQDGLRTYLIFGLMLTCTIVVYIKLCDFDEYLKPKLGII